MGFFKNLFGAYGKKAAISSIDLFTSLDPNTASDVQVRQYGDEVQRRAVLLVSAKNRVDALTTKVETCSDHVNKLKVAIQKIMDGPQTEATKKAIEEGLNEAEKYKADWKTYSKDLDQAKSDFETYKANHDSAVKRWTEAKDNFARLQENNTRLKEDLNRTKEQNEDAKTSAGLDNSIDTSTIINTAMEKKNQALQDQIDTLKVTMDSLNSNNTTNDILSEAMKDNTVTPSVEDRLKNL